MKKRHPLIYILPLFITLIVILFTLKNQPVKDARLALSTLRFAALGTCAQIQVRCQNPTAGQQAVTAARDKIAELETLLSTYRDDSELSRVNREAAATPVPVSPVTIHLIEQALAYSERTRGAFDITVPPLVEIWKTAARNDRLPDPCSIAAALSRTGFQAVKLQPEGTVSFARSGIQLNVNAIAKGYIVDAALEELRRPGIQAALVEIGGEIGCFGENKPGIPWTIGIQDPFSPDNNDQTSQQPLWSLELKDCAIATSGNYRRYLTIDGKKYSHIIDPRTGYPVKNAPSVTVIAANTTEADALATAVSVLGVAAGIALIESFPQAEVLLVTGSANHPELHTSSGWHNYRFQEVKPQ